MGIREFGDYYSGLAHLNHMMGLWRISPEDINLHQPMLQVRAIVIVTRGGLHLRVGERTHIMPAPSFADFSGCGAMLQFMSSSPDVDGYVFLFTSKYVVGLFKNHPPLSRSYVSHIQANPVCRLSPNAVTVLASDCQSLMATLNDNDNIFRQEIANSKTSIFYMDIANHFEHTIQTDGNADPEFTDRSMELFTIFVEKLRQNARQRHGVEYYASEINITPQYLNRVVREVSGRTPSEMVADAVVAEAKRMLDTTTLTLSQIATEMNFADQSVFTKFFKRMTSLTPLQYRNRK